MNRQERAALAHEQLTEALQTLADQNITPPCAADPDRSSWWLSDDPNERAQAAEACGPCPIRRQCGQTAHDAGERWGIWGGHDYSNRRTKGTA